MRGIKRKIVSLVMILSLIFSSSTVLQLSVSVQAATVKSIKVIHPNIAMNVGESSQIKAFVTPSSAKNVTFTYKSSNNKCVKVSKTGLVKGIKKGSAKITIKAKNSKAKKNVNVVVYKKGTKPTKQDDFYDAVNASVIDKMDLKGQPSTSRFSEVAEKISDSLDEILKEIAADGSQYGEIGKDIHNFYNIAIDENARKELGAAPLKKYVEKIETAKNISEYTDALIMINNELGMSSLLNVNVDIDIKDSNKYIYNVYGSTYLLNKTYFDDAYASVQALFMQYIKEIYALNEDGRDATEDISEVLKLCKSIADVSVDSRQVTPDMTYNMLSLDQIKELYSNIDIERYIKETGREKLETACVNDIEQAKFVNSLITQDNLELLKKYTKTCLYILTASMLTVDHYRAAERFNNAMLGSSAQQTLEEIASNDTKSMFEWEFSKLYTDKYFDEKSKEDVTNMAKKIISVYKKRINKIDWMTEKTKSKAIEKLNKMKLNIGYPEKWSSYVAGIEVKSKDEGETYFSVWEKLQKSNHDETNKLYGNPVSKENWITSPTTVNAFYNPTRNDITFPAGILQGVFYSQEHSKEQNYGGIGFVIGHEITHAFDNTGATFDADGNYSNWWQDSDYVEFTKRVNKMKTCYNGYEVKTGVFQNGDLTVGENISDVGSMACMLDIIGKKKSNLKKFFEAYANTWASKGTEEWTDYLLASDVHSLDKIRVNATVAMFDEFYSTFDIKKTDAMYVEPENRIKIW